MPHICTVSDDGLISSRYRRVKLNDLGAFEANCLPPENQQRSGFRRPPAELTRSSCLSLGDSDFLVPGYFIGFLHGRAQDYFSVISTVILQAALPETTISSKGAVKVIFVSVYCHGAGYALCF